MADIMTRVVVLHRQEEVGKAVRHRLPTSPRFVRGSMISAKPLEQKARMLLLKLVWSVRWLLRSIGV